MEDTSICTQIHKDVFLLCVCDGHGGTLAAEYVKKHLSKVLMSQQPFQEALAFMNIENQSSEGSYERGRVKQLLKEALENAFVELDIRLLNHLISMGSYVFPESTTTQKQKASLVRARGQHDLSRVVGRDRAALEAAL